MNSISKLRLLLLLGISLKYSDCRNFKQEYTFSVHEKIDYPTSPLKLVKDDLRNITFEKSKVPILKSSGEENGDFGKVSCRCVPRRACILQANKRQERLVNSPNCLDNEVMCCEKYNVGCGAVSKFPTFHPAPGYGEAKYGEFPWETLILDKRTDLIYGTGVIISPNIVLTTARNVHNYISKGFRVRVGEWDLSSDVEPFPALEYSVTEVVIHPNFNFKTFQNDLALLRLNSSIDLESTPTIRSICLGRPGEELEYYNQRCVTSGWAMKDLTRIVNEGSGPSPGGPGTTPATTIIRKLDLRVHDGRICERAIRKSIGNADYYWDEESFLCAGGEQGRGLCRGDEGTGLVCKGQNNRFLLLGLSSWGTNCGQSGFPNVFINIGTHYYWVKKYQQKFHP